MTYVNLSTFLRYSDMLGKTAITSAETPILKYFQHIPIGEKKRQKISRSSSGVCPDENTSSSPASASTPLAQASIRTCHLRPRLCVPHLTQREGRLDSPSLMADEFRIRQPGVRDPVDQRSPIYRDDNTGSSPTLLLEVSR